MLTFPDESKLNDVVTGVKPFVKDSRNILLIKPLTPEKLTRGFLISLQHALGKGIQFVFQVEFDSPLSPPETRDNPSFMGRRVLNISSLCLVRGYVTSGPEQSA